MPTVRFRSAMLLLVLVAGCGTQPAGSAGKRVVYPFTLAKGDGVDLRVTAEVTLRASGELERDAVMKVGTMMEARCTDVAADGTRVLTATMKEFDVDGAPRLDEDPGTVSVLRIGGDRLVTALEVDGQALPPRGPVRNPFVSGGFGFYTALPVGGMRIGDTVEYPPEVPDGTLAPSMLAMMEASDTKPVFRGVFTLKGTRREGERRIGDFEIDLRLTFDGALTLGGEAGTLVVEWTCKGTQSFDLATGLAHGSGVSTVTQRIEAKGGGDDSSMHTTAEIRAEAKPLE